MPGKLDGELIPSEASPNTTRILERKNKSPLSLPPVT